LKSDPSHIQALQKDGEDLLPDHAHPIGIVRVDATHMKQLRHSAVCWEGTELKFPLTVDEPPSRGGDATGPAPLSYFVLGAATCLLTQLAKLSMLGELQIDSLSVTARGHFERKLEGAFTDLIYDVRITGTEGDARVEKLCRDAERQCFASNTLRKAIDLVTNVDYNGRRLVALPLHPRTG
jgi:uncharacterized OsmC-like protein